MFVPAWGIVKPQFFTNRDTINHVLSTANTLSRFCGFTNAASLTAVLTNFTDPSSRIGENQVVMYAPRSSGFAWTYCSRTSVALGMPIFARQKPAAEVVMASAEPADSWSFKTGSADGFRTPIRLEKAIHAFNPQVQQLLGSLGGKRGGFSGGLCPARKFGKFPRENACTDAFLNLFSWCFYITRFSSLGSPKYFVPRYGILQIG